ncbi:hypothetical protein FOMPIDRAFT_1033502 [Fomitopsis schrenkii]|uniref:CFA20 domain-containing protein n=1 Tax=Fomitopsis schrenkii TaxID=2126942 RepID=S8DN36_FOMSC|nr:hypothetical protein FOMPIDRAFT_1033502 [Fomitopsis schrenkii]
MFAAAVQPALVSLFSSTGSSPLTLFSSRTDKFLPSDSCICLLKDSTSLPFPQPPATLIDVDLAQEELNEADKADYVIDQTVLHIQSPSLRTTHIQCPPLGWRGDLGIEHPWIHLQVRNLHREWSFEVGIVDRSGREGVVRCSTFQKEPQLMPGKRLLLHLPILFPPPSSRPLTSWSTITLNLPQFLPHFSSASLTRRDSNDDDAEEDGSYTSSNVPHVSSRPIAVPSGSYSHASYVKVYATCRLRRIFFTENGPRQELPWEFGLYSAD